MPLQAKAKVVDSDSDDDDQSVPGSTSARAGNAKALPRQTSAPTASPHAQPKGLAPQSAPTPAPKTARGLFDPPAPLAPRDLAPRQAASSAPPSKAERALSERQQSRRLLAGRKPKVGPPLTKHPVLGGAEARTSPLSPSTPLQFLPPASHAVPLPPHFDAGRDSAPPDPDRAPRAPAPEGPPGPANGVPGPLLGPAPVPSPRLDPMPGMPNPMALRDHCSSPISVVSVRSSTGSTASLIGPSPFPPSVSASRAVGTSASTARPPAGTLPSPDGADPAPLPPGSAGSLRSVESASSSASKRVTFAEEVPSPSPFGYRRAAAVVCHHSRSLSLHRTNIDYL